MENEGPVIHNYAIRLIRKDKIGRMSEDSVVNEIAFVEKCGYDYSIKDLVKKVHELDLPKDLMAQMAHNWVGKLPKGSPISVMSALRKQGYVSTQDVECWHTETNGKMSGRKFIISCDQEVRSLKRIIWEESDASAIEWEKSPEFTEAIKGFNHTSYDLRQWWM